jgi:predicted patatin/cPLA2 family phospholipase
MFKKGQFIKDKDTNRVYKVIKITNDLGHNRVYVLRPKGKRKDDEDIEERVDYVNNEYILDKKHTMREMKKIHEFLLKAWGAF